LSKNGLYSKVDLLGEDVIRISVVQSGLKKILLTKRKRWRLYLLFLFLLASKALFSRQIGIPQLVSCAQVREGKGDYF